MFDELGNLLDGEHPIANVAFNHLPTKGKLDRSSFRVSPDGP
jgi:hypothetical protein